MVKYKCECGNENPMQFNTLRVIFNANRHESKEVQCWRCLRIFIIEGQSEEEKTNPFGQAVLEEKDENEEIKEEQEKELKKQAEKEAKKEITELKKQATKQPVKQASKQPTKRIKK